MRGTTCGTVTESKLLRANQVLGVRSECRFQYKSSRINPLLAATADTRTTCYRAG
jgi:hypothetical protein